MVLALDTIGESIEEKFGDMQVLGYVSDLAPGTAAGEGSPC